MGEAAADQLLKRVRARLLGRAVYGGPCPLWCHCSPLFVLVLGYRSVCGGAKRKSVALLLFDDRALAWWRCDDRRVHRRALCALCTLPSPTPRVPLPAAAPSGAALTTVCREVCSHWLSPNKGYSVARYYPLHQRRRFVGYGRLSGFCDI